MKTICILVAVLGWASAQYGHGGHHDRYDGVVGLSNQEHGHGGGGDEGGDGGYGHSSGGGGGGGGDGGYGHGHGHATSYANVERHDGHGHEVHFKAHPQYHYGFKVADDKHHVYKTKHEERDGYKVKGSYSLVEPDGKTLRRVDYTSDKKQGFIAKVTYQHHH